MIKPQCTFIFSGKLLPRFLPDSTLATLHMLHPCLTLVRLILSLFAGIYYWFNSLWAKTCNKNLHSFILVAWLAHHKQDNTDRDITVLYFSSCVVVRCCLIAAAKPVAANRQASHSSFIRASAPACDECKSDCYSISPHDLFWNNF